MSADSSIGSRHNFNQDNMDDDGTSLLASIGIDSIVVVTNSASNFNSNSHSHGNDNTNSVNSSISRNNDDSKSQSLSHHTTRSITFHSSVDAAKAKKLYYNYILFCIFYSIAHGTVDGVLAYATAELGSNLGADSGFALYITYTLSALLVAKPILRYYGCKRSVFIGLCGMLCYVTSFFLAVIIKPLSYPIFMTGASAGGVCAGILWTAQGDYYSKNAYQYAIASDKKVKEVTINFASIFCVVYLFFETAFKILATAIFVADKNDDNWRSIVFGVYAISALLSVVAFQLNVSNLKITDSHVGNSRSSINNTTTTSSVISNASNSSSSGGGTGSWGSVKKDVIAVVTALSSNRKLQLLMPYQICFGLSSGFVGYYMNSYVVAKYIGDGYIGILSALSTFTAVILAVPYAKLSNKKKYGSWMIIIFGTLCFFFSAFPLTIYSNSDIAHWSFIVIYYCIHGAGRGAWESTNKAVITQYFPSEEMKDTAFASVYFTSGLAGAIGFFFYQYMSRGQLVLLNTIVPLIALICFHISSMIHDWDEEPSTGSEYGIAPDAEVV